MADTDSNEDLHHISPWTHRKVRGPICRPAVAHVSSAGQRKWVNTRKEWLRKSSEFDLRLEVSRLSRPPPLRSSQLLTPFHPRSPTPIFTSLLPGYQARGQAEDEETSRAILRFFLLLAILLPTLPSTLPSLLPLLPQSLVFFRPASCQCLHRHHLLLSFSTTSFTSSPPVPPPPPPQVVQRGAGRYNLTCPAGLSFEEIEQHIVHSTPFPKPIPLSTLVAMLLLPARAPLLLPPAPPRSHLFLILQLVPLQVSVMTEIWDD
eukprot:747870-Hanusia_phi.AAC.8